ncbi:MAG: sulfatase-like hydrolase/transferase [Pirellulales bacterium]
MRLFCVFIVGTYGINAIASTTEDDRRPNILFIIADDQSAYDLKVYEPKSALQTPVIARLAAEGMVFDGAYHMGSFSGAVCTPSRHMIMCGRGVWHLPIGPGAKDHCPPHLEQNTLAAVFNRAGYATMRTCKIGNSYDAANKQFAVRRDATKRAGDDENGSAWHAQQVLDYLAQRESDKDARPFLIYFGFSHPHDPRYGKPDLLAKYGVVNHADKSSLPPANAKAPALPINYLPAHPFHHGHPNLRDEVAVSGVWTNRDERTIRNEIGRQFACSENIDAQIGRVLDKLTALGELDNTYIFYVADHGMAIGRHGLQGKQNLYEHTWRVPFIARGPGIKPGTRVPGNIYLADVLATLCDLAGIAPPESNEGASFKPVLEGKQKIIRDVLYGTYSGGTKPGIRCVKQGDWKLIKYDVLDGKVRETQIFDLADNPDELLEQHAAADVVGLTGNSPKENQRNLAGDPRYADKLKEMEALLLAEMRRLDDPHRLWDQPVDGPAADDSATRDSAPQDAKQRKFEGKLDPFVGEPRLESQQLFKDERFPIVAVALDGTVLATFGNTGVRVRRSEDGGQTWGDEITIAKPGFQGGGTTVDETTGDVLAFVEEKHPPAPLVIYRSRDNGKTWTAQAESVIHPDSKGNMPSMHMNEHGITLRHGKHEGRLIRAARYYAAGNTRSEWPNHYTTAIYSDDGGKTWYTSDPFPENGTGEAAVAELSDGRIYYNSRVHWDARPNNMRRRSAWSKDGGKTWTDFRIAEALPDGNQTRSYGCMGGLVRLPVAGQDILIFSNLDTPKSVRERITVWASFDGGETWPVKRLVDAGPAGYSSLAAGRPATPSDGWIYLHYEVGKGGSQLARFNLSWLLSGEATGDGEIPNRLRP